MIGRLVHVFDRLATFRSGTRALKRPSTPEELAGELVRTVPVTPIAEALGGYCGDLDRCDYQNIVADYLWSELSD